MKTRSNMLRKRLANIIATKSPKSAKDALLQAGYSITTASVKQSAIINSDEVQRELARVGFTEAHAKARIASIMNSPMVNEMITPDNQLRASELALKVFGSFAPEKSINLNLNSPYKELTDDELANIAYKAQKSP